LLVSTLASYGDYQRERAWTWEHQALVRARCVAGDAELAAAFESVRAATLSRVRDQAVLQADVVSMRARMRAELDRGGDGLFDLKQGEGGLVDLEFLLQYLVLREAHVRPALLAPRATPLLVDALAQAGVLDAQGAAALCDAHALFVAAGLDCTLDRRTRMVPVDAALEEARNAIRVAWRQHGLDGQLRDAARAARLAPGPARYSARLIDGDEHDGRRRAAVAGHDRTRNRRRSPVERAVAARPRRGRQRLRVDPARAGATRLAGDALRVPACTRARGDHQQRRADARLV